jgi:hypothetical protein
MIPQNNSMPLTKIIIYVADENFNSCQQGRFVLVAQGVWQYGEKGAMLKLTVIISSPHLVAWNVADSQIRVRVMGSQDAMHFLAG